MRVRPPARRPRLRVRAHHDARAARPRPRPRGGRGRLGGPRGRLVGAGADGLGEDVSVFREDGTTLHEARPALPLEGEWTLAGFCDHLATLELWPQPPEWEAALRWRNWAFESAALDLALRQAGR